MSTGKRSKLHRLGRIFVGALFLLACLGTAPSANAGSISGTVTDEALTPIFDVLVDVYDLDYIRIGDALTDVNGAYTIDGLLTGDYKVVFNSDLFVDYAPEWWDNKLDFQSADPVSVTDGLPTENIDAVLAPPAGGSISGTVTDVSQNPIFDILVDVYDLNGNWIWYAFTDVNGVYSVPGLPEGDYKVVFNSDRFYPEYAFEWWDDKPDFQSADSVSVIADLPTENIDAALPPSGSITGTVTDEGLNPLFDVLVEIYDLNWNLIGELYTDASGAYTIGGLRAGSYKVIFNSDLYLANYAFEWWNDKPDFQSADPVSLTAGLPAEVDAALAPGGSISGTVTDDQLNPLVDVLVQIYDLNNTWIGELYTDDSGAYTIGGLHAGSYKVIFNSDLFVDFAPEWYDNKESFHVADAVGVGVGQVFVGVDAILSQSPLTDILWQESTGGWLYDWRMEGSKRIGSGYLEPSQINPTWRMVGIEDFNDDGKKDILWQEAAGGWLYVWYMDGLNRIGGSYLTPSKIDPTWRMVGIADFNDDGQEDILWQESAGGWLYVWYMDGVTKIGSEYLSPNQINPTWRMVGIADFNDDGEKDILWQETTGGWLYVWYMNGVIKIGSEYLTPNIINPTWRMVGVADFNGDGQEDILWQESKAGWLYLWYMDGVKRIGGEYLTPNLINPTWRMVGIGLLK